VVAEGEGLTDCDRSVLCEWETRPVSRALPENEVHIWRTLLNLPSRAVSGLVGILDSEERTKAEGLRFPRDRERYIAAHSALRQILSHYLALPPDTLRFTHSVFGKPTLRDFPSFRFNLSHSEDCALLAVTRNREVGIDVEAIHADFAWEEIAPFFCAKDEIHQLHSLPEADRAPAFYQQWVRVEALLKASGAGIGYLQPADKHLASLQQEFRLRDFIPMPGYVGAVAARGGGWSPRFFSVSLFDREFFLQNGKNA
jgi:4'-phosphopantetheinyl transferase